MNKIDFHYVDSNLKKYRHVFNQLNTEHEIPIREMSLHIKSIWDKLKLWDKRWSGSWTERQTYYKRKVIGNSVNENWAYEGIKNQIDKNSGGITFTKILENSAKHIRPYQELNDELIPKFKVLQNDPSFGDCLSSFDKLEKFVWHDSLDDLWNTLGCSQIKFVSVIPPHKHVQHDILLLQSIYLKIPDYVRLLNRFLNEVDVLLQTNIDVLNRKESAIRKYNYVDKNRIDTLKAITNSKFNLNKLIRICEELNDNWEKKNFICVASLNRVLIDHVAPVFDSSYTSFDNVCSSYPWGKSEKIIMEQLLKTSKNVSHLNLHTLVSATDDYPTSTQLNCHSNIDRLLKEIVIILNKP